jgi:hypothetical protein
MRKQYIWPAQTKQMNSFNPNHNTNTQTKATQPTKKHANTIQKTLKEPLLERNPLNEKRQSKYFKARWCSGQA